MLYYEVTRCGCFFVLPETCPRGSTCGASYLFAGGLRFSYALGRSGVQVVNFGLRLIKCKCNLFFDNVQTVGVERINHVLYKLIRGGAACAVR